MLPLPFVLTSSCRYFHEMPWVALDYAQRELKVAMVAVVVVAVLVIRVMILHLFLCNCCCVVSFICPPCCLGMSYHATQGLLSEAFNVEGIPTLVLIDPKTGACNALSLKLCC